VSGGSRYILSFLIATFVFAVSTGAAAGPASQENPGSVQNLQQDSAVSSPGTTQAGEMTDIIEIRPPVGYGIDPRLLFLGLAFVVVLAAIAALYLWGKKRKTTAHKPILPPVPEDEAALDALRNLENGALIPDREFYFRLTGIIREYLDRRYDTDTLEKTTEELVPIFRQIAAENELKTYLLNLLRGADPVKYATVPAGPARRREDMQFALNFVRATRRGPEQEKPNVPV